MTVKEVLAPFGTSVYGSITGDKKELIELLESAGIELYVDAMSFDAYTRLIQMRLKSKKYYGGLTVDLSATLYRS